MKTAKGLSLISLLIALVVIFVLVMIVMRYTGQLGLEGGETPSTVMDSTAQQRTIADMQAIGRANAAKQASDGSYALALVDLERGGYLVQVPPTDGWGNAWSYVASRSSYTLTSRGADGAVGPAPPSPWPGAPYEPDVVLRNGQFTQSPTRR